LALAASPTMAPQEWALRLLPIAKMFGEKHRVNVLIAVGASITAFDNQLTEDMVWYSRQEKKDNRKTPQNTVALQTATVKPGAEEAADVDLQYCFRVVSTERSYVLQATDELEATEWMQTIQVRTQCSRTCRNQNSSN